MSGKEQKVMVILLLKIYVVHGTACIQGRIIKIGQRENLRGISRDMRVSLKIFLEVVSKWDSWDATTF